MEQMFELKMLLVNGLLIFGALAAFHMFKTWTTTMQSHYKIRSLEDEALRGVNEIRGRLASVSSYEVDRVKESLHKLGPICEVSNKIEYLRNDIHAAKKETIALRGEVKTVKDHLLGQGAQ